MKTLLICALFSLTLNQQVTNPGKDFEELANGYDHQGKLVEAAEFYSKAGYSYWNRDNEPQAVTVFEKAYTLFSKQNNLFACITVGNNLGLIYLDLEKYKEAYHAFNNVLTFTRKTKNTTEIFNALVNTGSTAIELKSYEDAVNKASEALTLAKEINSLKDIARCYSILAESYEKMGKSSDAYKYFELYSSVDHQIKKEQMENVKEMSDEEVKKAHEKKRMTEIELKIKKGQLKLTQDSLSVSERLAFERQMQVELRNEQLKKKEIQLRYEHQIRQYLMAGMSIILIFLLVVGYMLWQKLRDNKTLRLQKEEITGQRNELDIKNKKITDSIYYGLRIQQAMLPDVKALEKIFDSFVIFRPKDIVSGDFYWFYETRIGDLIHRFIAVVDCTGHGVPGAFMSMIGHRLLTEIVVERRIYQPSKVLELMNDKLVLELNQEHKHSNDGMDIAFCRITMKGQDYVEGVFAGAKRPIITGKFGGSKLTMIDADRKSLGGYLSGEPKTFTDNTFPVDKGDLIILYTDGIIDQHNFERKRFGTERFTRILENNMNQPLIGIKTSLENAYNAYTEPDEQRDDITIVGLRIK